MRVIIFLSVLAVLTACGTRTAYMPLNPSPRALKARAPSVVELFTTSKPLKQYVEVGMIEVQDVSGLTSNESVFADLRAEAARRGCDAVIVTGRTETIKGYGGTCIVYEDAAASR
jgi:hypothetical protein